MQRQIVRGAGTIVSVAFAVYLSSHPHWTSDHPTLTKALYYVAVVAAIYLLLTIILQWKWMQRLFGIARASTSDTPTKETPPSNQSPPNRLKIISAYWGVEGVAGGDLDRTDCLLEKQSGNLFAYLVGLDLFHGCIPAPGNKRVKVRYSFDGREATVVRQEGEFLMLPEDPYFANLFCPLQLKAFRLAKDLGDFLKTELASFPKPIDPARETVEVVHKHSGERIAWRKRTTYKYQSLQFEEREKELIVGFGALGVSMNYATNSPNPGLKKIEDDIPEAIAAIVATAHKIDGLDLIMRTR